MSGPLKFLFQGAGGRHSLHAEEEEDTVSHLRSRPLGSETKISSIRPTTSLKHSTSQLDLGGQDAGGLPARHCICSLLIRV
jgi:hypothetical protein